MTAHRARVEFTATDLETMLPILKRLPWGGSPAVKKIIEKLERAQRMTDR